MASEAYQKRKSPLEAVFPEIQSGTSSCSRPNCSSTSPANSEAGNAISSLRSRCRPFQKQMAIESLLLRSTISCWLEMILWISSCLVMTEQPADWNSRRTVLKSLGNPESIFRLLFEAVMPASCSSRVLLSFSLTCHNS